MIKILAATLFLLMPTSENGDLEGLAWLSGCWELNQGGRVVEEQWTKPRGGTMVGLGRTTKSGKTTFIEFLEIQASDSGVFYIARPGGKTPVPFKLVSTKDNRWVFENLTHDFPQRIIYTRLSEATMNVRLEGMVGGQLRGNDLAFQRDECP